MLSLRWCRAPLRELEVAFAMPRGLGMKAGIARGWRALAVDGTGLTSKTTDDGASLYSGPGSSLGISMSVTMGSLAASAEGRVRAPREPESPKTKKPARRQSDFVGGGRRITKAIAEPVGIDTMLVGRRAAKVSFTTPPTVRSVQPNTYAASVGVAPNWRLRRVNGEELLPQSASHGSSLSAATAAVTADPWAKVTKTGIVKNAGRLRKQFHLLEFVTLPHVLSGIDDDHNGGHGDDHNVTRPATNWAAAVAGSVPADERGSLTLDSELIVTGVEPDSVAESRGVQVGWQLRSVGGIRVRTPDRLHVAVVHVVAFALRSRLQRELSQDGLGGEGQQAGPGDENGIFSFISSLTLSPLYSDSMSGVNGVAATSLAPASADGAESVPVFDKTKFLTSGSSDPSNDDDVAALRTELDACWLAGTLSSATVRAWIEAMPKVELEFETFGFGVPKLQQQDGAGPPSIHEGWDGGLGWQSDADGKRIHMRNDGSPRSDSPTPAALPPTNLFYGAAASFSPRASIAANAAKIKLATAVAMRSADETLLDLPIVTWTVKSNLFEFEIAPDEACPLRKVGCTIPGCGVAVSTE